MTAPDPDRTRMMPHDAGAAVTTPMPAAGTPAPSGAPAPTGATLGAAAGAKHAPPVIPDVAIEVELGRGGMGVVYKGRQTYVDRAVAVKVLSAVGAGQHANEYVQRFQREARILANLAHPHIVACYQAGVTTDGAPYLVMEFIDGPNLWQWIREHGALPEPQALRVVADIARALGHAHEQGIIHRDVKPENILLAGRPGGADGVLPFTAKLVDLGLARPHRGGGPAAMQVTMPGMVMGTPATMAPEQFDDPENVDHRADIYGLGCVLYHALTGRPAFGGTSLVDIVASKAAGPAPDPRRLASRLSARTVELVRSMLAARPELRPQTYQAIIDACDRAPGTRSGGRAAPRSRALAIAVAIAALASAAGIAWWQRGRAHDAVDRTAPTSPPVAAPAMAASPAVPAVGVAPAVPASTTSVAAAATEGAASTLPSSTSPASATDASPGGGGETPAAAADTSIIFAAPTALLGTAFDRRLAGWEPGPGWGPEEEGGEGVSGVSGGRDATLCAHPLRAPDLCLTGLIASGAAGADGRFREAGVTLDLADGGSVSLKIQDYGASMRLAVVAKTADGNVAATPQFRDLDGDPLRGWRFALTVRDRTLIAELGDQRTNPLPLLAAPRGVSLFVVKGAVAFRDLAVAYPR